ncbi:FAD-dependent thymidylate synthase [Candidatus Dojkabacteria bacterium]|nr:FAD-dependent thymidylate synthase [Candidatus Dojkabacteria bacterium]
MKLKSSFNKVLNIASLESKDAQIKVHTLLQSEKNKQPSINAYLGARYSRSADSITDIAKEIMESKTDAAKKLEMIFQGYGHKSVGDMAGIFVCIENIPMFLAQKLFYMNPVHAGQERSTRYQNFQEPEFAKMPKGTDPEIAKEYEEIFNLWMQNYLEVMEPTKQALQKQFKPDKGDKMQKGALQARTFDTARFFLPIGLQTSLALSMSARSWAELIGYLRASNLGVARELGEMLYVLLTGNDELKKEGYVPEADGLIRHTEANQTRNNSTREILELIRNKSLPKKNLSLQTPQTSNSKVNLGNSAIRDFSRHYALLINPLADVDKFKLDNVTLKKIGRILSKYHNQHNQIGTIAQTGAILIEGFGDYGSVLKDINRHRSLERFFPLLEDWVDIDAELGREESECFFLCDYLEINSFEKLRADYKKRFDRTYKRLKNWSLNAKGKISEDLRLEYTRYLLPHAHACRYRLYGSIDDWQYLIHLRIRNGGHISYRKLAYDWLVRLSKAAPVFTGMADKLEKVDHNSREQFFDRS